MYLRWASRLGALAPPSRPAMRSKGLPTAVEAGVEDALAGSVELIDPVDRGAIPVGNALGGEGPSPRVLWLARSTLRTGGLGPPEEVQEPLYRGGAPPCGSPLHR